MSNLIGPDFEMSPFFEMTPDLVCIAGKDGYFRKINTSVIQKLEFSEEELFANPISSFIHPDDRETTSRERIKLLNGSPLISFQNRYITRSGKIVWLDWTSIYFPDREVVFAIAKDVTARKEMEKEIEEKYKKFKSLATHFKSSIEKDRKYLAVELHEELAQLASVVKMDIDWINEHTPGLSITSQNRLEHALAVSDLLIKGMRRISFSISPHMLDDLGLNETLQWLCKEFAILNGISCVFKSTGKEFLLTQEVKLDFFRICQQALSNVMYHAEASQVEIVIEEKDGHVCLSVSDNGKGFEIGQQTQMAGLKNMEERAASINGRLMISSKPGKGTKISVVLA